MQEKGCLGSGLSIFSNIMYAFKIQKYLFQLGTEASILFFLGDWFHGFVLIKTEGCIIDHLVLSGIRATMFWPTESGGAKNEMHTCWSGPNSSSIVHKLEDLTLNLDS